MLSKFKRVHFLPSKSPKRIRVKSLKLLPMEIKASFPFLPREQYRLFPFAEQSIGSVCLSPLVYSFFFPSKPLTIAISLESGLIFHDGRDRPLNFKPAVRELENLYFTFVVPKSLYSTLRFPPPIFPLRVILGFQSFKGSKVINTPSFPKRIRGIKTNAVRTNLSIFLTKGKFKNPAFGGLHTIKMPWQ